MVVSQICFDSLDLQRFEMEFLHLHDGTVGVEFLQWAGRESHGNVDVLKDLPRGDAQNSVAGLDEIVALSSTMLTAEVIGEAEA